MVYVLICAPVADRLSMRCACCCAGRIKEAGEMAGRGVGRRWCFRNKAERKLCTAAKRKRRVPKLVYEGAACSAGSVLVRVAEQSAGWLRNGAARKECQEQYDKSPQQECLHRLRLLQ